MRMLTEVRHLSSFAAWLHVSLNAVRYLAKTATKKLSQLALGDATAARLTVALVRELKARVAPLTFPSMPDDLIPLRNVRVPLSRHL
jgi:hypothetical protein